MTPPIVNSVNVGRVTLVDDAADVQRVQVTEGALGKGGTTRVTDKVRRVTDFGFVSHPPIDAEAVVIHIAGDRTKPIVIATSHRPSRPRDQLKEGDTAIYDVRGAIIWLSEDGIIVDGAGLPVTIRNAPKVRCEVDLVEVTGDVVSRADGEQVSLNDLHDKYNQHVHHGVQVGGGQTGAPDPTA